MTREEVKQILDGAGVSSAFYRFDENHPFEGYCLVERGHLWKVYFMERGEIRDEATYASESEACVAFMIRLLNDLKHLPKWK